MTVALIGDVIALSGACEVADAEPLLALLVGHPQAPVDIAGASRVHTALWQLLMACRSRIIDAPPDSFATKWLVPSISGAD